MQTMRFELSDLARGNNSNARPEQTGSVKRPAQSKALEVNLRMEINISIEVSVPDDGQVGVNDDGGGQHAIRIESATVKLAGVKPKTD